MIRPNTIPHSSIIIVAFSILASIAVGIFLPTTSFAAPIYSEVFNGNGETRTVTIRTLTAPQTGTYRLTLKNGTTGPRFIGQCETEDTTEEKRQCLFNNLTEKIDQDFSRVQDAMILINGVRIRNPLAVNEKTITKSRGLLSLPVNLIAGANTINVDLLGFSTARLDLSVEAPPTPDPEAPPAGTTPQAPLAFFLLNRLTGTTAQSFTLNARESFSPEGHLISYAWLWGDELTGTPHAPGTVTATHVFSNPGTYKASLKVTDLTTFTSSTFGIDLVVKAVTPGQPQTNEKPKPVIQWALDNTNPFHVLFNGSQSTDDGQINLYTWKFTNQSGQSQTITGESIDHTFLTAGTYTVRLTVKDSLGLSAATERVISVAPLATLVQDEILFANKTYFGTLSLENITTETIIIPYPKLARLKIKNGDGLEHPISDCGLIPWPIKIGCRFTNLVNRTYLSLYRVNSANVYINGRKVTDPTSINKQKASFETVISLNQTNSVEMRVRGWPTAFVSMEIQALEENIAPMAHVTFQNPLRGVPRTVEFDATTSTDTNDRVVSYRFHAQGGTAPPNTAPPGGALLDTDWQASPIGALTFTETGLYDVVVSARDQFGAVGTTTTTINILPNTTPIISSLLYRVLSDRAPYQVRILAQGSDQDINDPLEYNFEFSNGQMSGFQSASSAVTVFDSTGDKSAVVTVRDASGETATSTIQIHLGGNLIPIANFTMSPARADYAPNTITFNASTSYDADGSDQSLRYFWNFGDGSAQSEGKILTHTFPPGEFIVNLSVLDLKNGLGTLSRAVFAWQDSPPIPNYVVLTGTAPFQMLFDASTSLQGNSPIIRYRFDVGTSGFIDQSSPLLSYTYPRAGVYATSLRVYDQEGDANILSKNVTVFNGVKPTANITNQSIDAVSPASYTFSSSGSISPSIGAVIDTVKWTLPDGEIRFGSPITYTKTTLGDFDVTLEVRDSAGVWSDPVTKTSSTSSGAIPQAIITANKLEVILGEPILFSGVNSFSRNKFTNLSTFEWTTPNGTKLFGANQTITLTQTGLKTITLKVTDSKGYISNVESLQVNVLSKQPPTAVINLAASGPQVFPITLRAHGLSSTTPNPNATITGYEWLVSASAVPASGMPASFSMFGAEVNIVLPQSATWTVALRVFDSAGQTSSWTSEIVGIPVNELPVAVMSPLGLIDSAPATIAFNGLSSSDPDGSQIINWHWLFGDGTSTFAPTPSHYYENPGSYTVTLRVQDQNFAWSDPVSMTVTVLPNQAPIAFITSQDDPNNRFRKILNAETSFDPDGVITQYFWYINSENTVLGQGPELNYIFQAAGTYTVGVDVYDNKGAKASNSIVVTISPDAPTIIKAHYEVDATDTMKFAFKASDSTDGDGIISFKWTEGTDVLSTTADFTKTFATEGVHHVALEIKDTTGAVTTKMFDVHASLSPIAGIRVVSVDAEPVDYFSSASIGAQLPIEISSLPMAAKLQPELTIPQGTLDFDWQINGINNGSSDALTVFLVEPSLTHLTLTVSDQGNIIARSSRDVTPLSSSCTSELDESEEVLCASAANAISGVPIFTQDLVFDLQITGTITNIESIQITSLKDSYQTDLSNVATGSVRSVVIPRSAILNLSNLDSGPFTASIEAQTTDGFITARVPFFNLAGSTLSFPSSAVPTRLHITDAYSGRTIIDETNGQGLVVSVPTSKLSVYMTQKSVGALEHVALGDIKPTFKSNQQVSVTFDPDTKEFGSVLLGSTIASLSTPSTSNVSSLAAEPCGLAVCPDSGIVAGFHTFAAFPAGSISNDYKQVLDIKNNSIGFGGTSTYAAKAVNIPWSDYADGTSPIGRETPQQRSLECKAFEASWLIDSKISKLVADADANRVDRLSIDHIYKIIFDADAAYLTAKNPFPSFTDAQLLALAGNPAGQDGSTIILLNKFAEAYEQRANTHAQYDGVLASAIARYQSFYIRYFGVEQVTPLSGIGSTSGLAYTLPGTHLVGVQVAYVRNGKNPIIQNIHFDTASLKGDFEAPNVPLDLLTVTPPIKVNPFDETSTKPFLIPLDIPAGTTSISIKVAPLSPPERKVLTRKINGADATVTSTFSAACRLSEESYSVRSVRYDSLLSNPPVGLSTTATNAIEEFLNDPLAKIDSALKPNDSSLATRLTRVKAYASRSIFSNKSAIPVDLDTQDTSSHQNQLWQYLTPNLPIPADLNHVVKIKVRHPSGQPATGVDLIVKVGTEVSATVLATEIAGTRTASATSYQAALPVNQIINSAASTIVNGSPNGLALSIEARPRVPLLSTAQTISKYYKPTVFYNAKYKTFTEGSAERALYGNKISAMISYDMTRVVQKLDAIGLRTINGNTVNDFKINDGSLAFGSSFSPHMGHDDGHRLDVRPFGTQSDAYDATGKTTTPAAALFGPNTKYDDIAILMRASHIAQIVNSNSMTKLKIEFDCIDLPDECVLVPSIEKCLFFETAPEINSTCKAIHDEIVGTGDANVVMKKVRDANGRLAAWVQRNQEVLISLKTELNAMVPSIKNFQILYSSGTFKKSKTALAHRANQFSSSSYLIPEDLNENDISNVALPDAWNFNLLFDSAIPKVSDTVANKQWGDEQIYLLTSDAKKIPINSEIKMLFRAEEKADHFDHFHLEIR